MKTRIIVSALCALALAVSCQVAETEFAPISNSATITAVIDNGTKTAYEEETAFSWVSGDAIVIVVNDPAERALQHYTYHATESGPTSSFTGGEITDPWEPSGFALYKSSYGGDMDNMTVTLANTYTLEEDAFMSVIPLVGKASEEDPELYTFKTAVGVLKVDLANVPPFAKKVMLSTEANITGTYYFTDNTPGSGISMDDVAEGYGNLTLVLPARTDVADLTVYFPVPVGEIPAGATISVLQDDDTQLFVTDPTVSAIPVERNVVLHITPSGPLTLDDYQVFALDDIIGEYDMEVTPHSYGSSAKTGDLVLEYSDDESYGNVMMTKFAGVSGKAYGNFDGRMITFAKEQIFGLNPFSDAAEKPYIALDFFNGGVVDPTFQVIESGVIEAVGIEACGMRTCTEEDWASFAGGWPWAIGYATLTARWKVPSEWVSLGSAQFIDSYVWSDCGFTEGEYVWAELYEDSTNPGSYRLENPYVVAAAQFGADVADDADEWLEFSIADRNYINYNWTNMGLKLSKNSEKTWAMISGYAVAGYANDLSHVVSTLDDSGTIAQVQLAPCYRTSDENRTSYPSDYANEIGKDHDNNVIEIVFPGNSPMNYVTVSDISVSANQEGDGDGAPALVDNSLSSYWHTPWSYIDEAPDQDYGQYVDLTVPDGLSEVSLNYCTRKHSNMSGAPARVVVGGAVDGMGWEIITIFELESMLNVSSNTWIALPEISISGYNTIRFGIATNVGGFDMCSVATEANEKWVNLAEIAVFGR